jgi:outer membrane protein assembly factor BamA
MLMAQDVATDSCAQRDVGDTFRGWTDKGPKPDVGNAGSILLIPIIGSNPATGFMVGVGLQYGFKLPGDNTRFSMVSGSVQYTTKDQKIFLLKNSIYTKNNKLFLTGDWRYLVFSQATYGLGTNSPAGGILDYQFSLSGQETSDDSLTQPLNYNFLRLYQSMSYNVKGSFYVGFGFRLDAYSKIVDQKLDLTPGAEVITSHYAYNTYYGYSTTNYSSTTLDVNLIYDTRDNMINPYRGQFALLTWRGQIIDKGQGSHFISAEWRSYHPLSKRNPRHLLAFWLLGDFSPAGEFQYMILPATGYDQRSRSGRGYSQGRFRGNNLMYGEAEYRFPISRCGGVWGGVLFVNATTASNPVTKQDLFVSVKPGYGFGLRLMVDKKTRTNLAIDMGFGDKSSGFYLAATETF